MTGTIEFSLNIFTEFFAPATQPPLVLETRMLPRCQQDIF